MSPNKRIFLNITYTEGSDPFDYGCFQAATGARHAFQAVFSEPFVAADCFTRTDPVVVPARTLFPQLV